MSESIWRSKQYPFIVIIIILNFILWGCVAKDLATSESTESDIAPGGALVIPVAIPDGTYLVGTTPTGESIPARTVCASDNSRPILDSSTGYRQLVLFGDLVSNSMTITIAGNNITKTWTRDSDLFSVYPNAVHEGTAPFGYTGESCTVIWTGTISTNQRITFKESSIYSIEWPLAACDFEVHDWGTNSIGGALIPTRYVNTNLSTAIGYRYPPTNFSSTITQHEWTVSSSGNVYTLTMPASVAATQTAYSCADGGHVVKMVWTKQ
ncbi:MAG: hypothetical protein HQK53_08925 [Oligoflexia bacterium]|nr:hypothetical protein [Oligoflexia bacterium]